jgi:hypothetical protein
MSARIIHVGEDACHRVGVLVSAGYRVEECHSIEKLREVLESDSQPDAVVITEEHSKLFRQAVALLHEHTEFPLILFGELQRSITESEFDLVIPFLASPEAWLSQVATLISQCQAVRMRHRMPGGQSALSRRQSKLRQTGKEPSSDGR